MLGGTGPIDHRRTERDLTLDAVVAAVALTRAPSVLLTADPDDLCLPAVRAAVRVIEI